VGVDTLAVTWDYSGTTTTSRYKNGGGSELKSVQYPDMHYKTETFNAFIGIEIDVAARGHNSHG
jgi:hypothetical protein